MNNFDNLPPPPRPAMQLRLPLARPWLSWGLLGLTIIIFIGQIVSEITLGGDLPAALGAKINSYIVAGQWWRLLTPMLLHASLMHIAFNAYALYVLGPNIEALFGTARFAVIYLLAGLAGNVLSFIFNPYPSVGASTALFGLIAAEFIFFYRNRDKFGQLAQSRLTNLAVIIVINFAWGLSGEGIDNFGHLGGFLGGLAAGWLLCPRYEIEPFGPNGLPHIVDRNSLQNAWRGVVAVALTIIAMAYATILMRL